MGGLEGKIAVVRGTGEFGLAAVKRLAGTEAVVCIKAAVSQDLSPAERKVLRDDRLAASLPSPAAKRCLVNTGK